MHIKNIFKIYIILFFTISGDATAYDFTFSNPTNKDAYLKYDGIAYPGDNLFRGKCVLCGKYSKEVRNNGKLIIYHGAGWIYETAEIPAKTTVIFQHRGIQSGYCLKVHDGSIKVGFKGSQLFPMDVKMIHSEQMAAITSAWEGMGDALKSAGQDVSGTPNPAGQAAGAVASTLGSLTKGITGLGSMSTCTELSFLINEGKYGQPELFMYR